MTEDLPLHGSSTPATQFTVQGSPSFPSEGTAPHPSPIPQCREPCDLSPSNKLLFLFAEIDLILIFSIENLESHQNTLVTVWLPNCP